MTQQRCFLKKNYKNNFFQRYKSDFCAYFTLVLLAEQNILLVFLYVCMVWYIYIGIIRETAL